MKKPFWGSFETSSDSRHMLGALQHIQVPMRRFKELKEVDYVIVGVGSAGGVLLQRLARAGFNVIGIEAGPFWDTDLPYNFFMQRYTDSFTAEIQAFTEAVLDDKPIPVTGAESRMPVVMALAAGKSSHGHIVPSV